MGKRTKLFKETTTEDTAEQKIFLGKGKKEKALGLPYSPFE